MTRPRDESDVEHEHYARLEAARYERDRPLSPREQSRVADDWEGAEPRSRLTLACGCDLEYAASMWHPEGCMDGSNG